MNIGKLEINVSDRLSIEFSDPIRKENGITTYANRPYRFYYSFERSEKPISEAVNDIGIVFSNPNLKITDLGLRMGYTNPDKQDHNEIISFQENFVQSLKSMMSSLPHQIHVEYVFLECYEILPFLKSEKLKMIDLSPMEITDDSLHKIAHLEQIKRLPAIRILHMLDHVPFDIISNTSMFGIFVRNFSKSDFTRFVEQNLQQENFELGEVHIDGNGIGYWITEFLLKHQAVKTDDGYLIATLEGPKFKNTVEVGEIEGQKAIVFKRTT
ncbi:hypothetical protein GCK72_004327 [Caenorhabditis remanei]|uniref:DUF38 domain-containing protein n=1 Tax=Caenorhabditis remanei TaxID=31234 RepID=A0A6A5H981_CAERE|nr:hypothetical protein GCK72_004327 [Caenorhabditis remanei]KAF1764380.1 hypothetical protein GCK72_004327 [Caenorhabditis remanei]